MALTEAQKHLIAGLKLFGVETEAIVGIVSVLQSREQLRSMMIWMSENEGASTAEFLKKTAEIVNGN